MIVSMKKISLFALKPDKDKLMLALQKCGEFMAIPPEGGGAASTHWGPKAQQTLAGIKFIDGYGEKSSMFSPLPPISYEDFVADMEEGRELDREVAELARSLSLLKSEGANKRLTLEQLLPWMELDVAFEDIRPTKKARLFAGYMDPRQLESLVELDELAEVTALGAGPEGRALFVACHESVQERVQEVLNKAGFVENAPRLKGTPAQAAQELKAQILKCDEDIVALEARAAELAQRSQRIKELYDATVAKNERESVQVQATQSAFFIQGWVRSDKVEKVEKAVASVTSDYEMYSEDPAQDEIPPTYTRNSKAVTPFEAITELYSLPDYRGMDPNFIMAPFYALFFGMMTGDAGYGLVLALAVAVFLKVRKPKGMMKKLLGVFFIAGLASIVCGILMGSVFGVEIPTGIIYPMKDTITLLLLTCGIGVVQIFVGLILKMSADIKAGDVLGAIADNLSWILLISGLIMLFVPPLDKAGIYVAGLGALIILFFAGRDKKNPIKRLISGLKGLYDITGYMSDIVSYTRIAALGMSSGVIAMVINQLACMFGFEGSVLGIIGYVVRVVILIFGHTFNLAIGLLGAFVHSSRLQFVEFYGKFYQIGGRAFVPLSFKTKFVDVQDS